MAQTNATRQAAYRQRHLHDEGGTGERLNVVIDLHAKRALERLASCYGVTQRQNDRKLGRHAHVSQIAPLFLSSPGPSPTPARPLHCAIQLNL